MKPTPPKPQPKPAPAVPALKPETPPAPKPPATKESDSRLTIPLDASGRPDVASMRDRTKEKVRRLISDPDVARSLGVTPDAAPAVAVVPRVITDSLVRAIEQIETVLVSRVTKAPAPIVLAVCKYTPDEREAIAVPLEGVLNKYSPKLFSKYGEEIALASVLVMITMSKIETVRAAVQANTPRPAPAVVVPMPAREPEPPAPAPNADDAGQIPPEVLQ